MGIRQLIIARYWRARFGIGTYTRYSSGIFDLSQATTVKNDTAERL